MTSPSRTRITLGRLVAALAVVLPALSLVPLGGLWLIERGYALPWAIAACLLTLAAWLLLRSVLRPAPGTTAHPSATGEAQRPDPGWTPAEVAAWAEVERIAETIDVDRLDGREAVLALGQQTIEAVARAIYPERRDPLWQFTAPEALALVEQVARKLRTLAADSVPLGDRLTVGQMLQVYRWRGAAGMAEKAYDLWRIIRLLNPVTAATQELRERLTKEVYAWGRTELATRLARTFVREVGRAAIDLYGGRLAITPDRVEAHVTAETRRDAAVADAPAEPIRVLIAGRTKAGKSSLVNALAAEVRAAVDVLPATPAVTPYRLEREGTPAALLLDTPGLTDDAAAIARLTEAALTADLVLWVVDASRADRAPDRRGLEALRAAFRARPDRRPPPVVLVATHIDRLRPFADWQPPYPLSPDATGKAASIRDALTAATGDLEIAIEDAVPVSLAPDRLAYNVDAIWALISERLPEAESARLVRVLRDASSGIDLARLWAQTRGAGRVMVDTLRRS
jgi:hypothetical protein